ncbi:MAG: fibronectin type III domain-containing protein [Candidatus Neomarinimicrobiota bacterium]
MKKFFKQNMRGVNQSVVVLIFLVFTGIQAQNDNAVDPNSKSYIRVGSLQSHISAYGAERAWTGSYYEGLIWPADYLYQDNAVIKRSFLAVENWTDAVGEPWDYWATYISLGNADLTLFPVELSQVSKYDLPLVLVDGNNISAPLMNDITEPINPDQIPDRIVTNTVNTFCGLTFTRRVLAFTQQYHDNYFIKEIVLHNTGNTDYDDDIELTNMLHGVRIGWSTRYAVSRDGASTMADGSQKWGKHTWVTKRGEDYASHQGEMFTEAEGIQDWIRLGFCYLGQNEASTYSTIGAPDLYENGRLCSPQHVGTGILHVPVSTIDTTDDATQPAVLGWHAGDTYPTGGSNNKGSIPAMKQMWDFLDGIPFGIGMGDDDRMDETHMTDNWVDPYTIHRDGGGTNLWIGYGPFDIPHGDSVVIVEVEAIDGLDREKCIQIGRKWYEAYKSENQSTSYDFEMPDGTIKTGTYADGSADAYKNAWIFTGKDSILKTIGRAYRNYKSGYAIPQPPAPPTTFEVASGGDKITLSWNLSPDDSEPDFAGYRIYRAVHKPDTVHTLLATVGAGITSYEDKTPSRGLDYYYYITAFNDGSNNTSGELNPSGPLESGRFYTKTTEPANLKRKQGENLADIIIVPNPYNISANKLQYSESGVDKIGFLNIPGKCVIKIYSERGDLIETIQHDDGSGDEYWNSISSARQVVVSGLYIAYFEVSENIFDEETGEKIFSKGENTFRKFIIVR